MEVVDVEKAQDDEEELIGERDQGDGVLERDQGDGGVLWEIVLEIHLVRFYDGC